MSDIIVVGGGTTGLMVAAELSKQNKKVTLLEASERLGGRIHTVNNEFSMPVELGAEFIHGDLPITINLLKEAGIKFYKMAGKMFYIDKGKIKKDDENDYWNDMMHMMKNLEEDMPLQEFLIKFFNDDKYEHLRDSVKGFAQGFDLADITKASTLSLYNEWKNEGSNVYRIEGGYQQLINYLEAECKKNGCIIYTDCCAKKISHQQNNVSVLSMCSRIFKSEKIVITVPVCALQSNKLSADYIEFEPAIEEHINAAKNIAYGAVIKILFEFDEPFWNEQKSNIGFLITDGFIRTWWTQLPNENAILTGWLGGPKASELKAESDDFIKQKAIESLALAFNKSKQFIQKKLIASKIINWQNVKNISGGYSYNTIKSVEAKKVLQHPINETVFFAGEAIYDGKDEGTVEAALISAKKIVDKVLKLDNIE